MLPVIFNNQLFRDLLNNDFTKDMEKVFRRNECDLMKTTVVLKSISIYPALRKKKSMRN